MGFETVKLRPLNTASLRIQIVEQIRAAIIDGNFRPGERLNETLLAERLGVSRAPVREAFSVLEKEGLIVNVPRRGSFVINFTDKDIEEIYTLRLALEVTALRRAIGRLSEQDLAEMQGMVDFLGQIGHRERSAEVVRVDLSFHALICRAADHQRLYSMWNGMQQQTQLLIALTSKTHINHPEQSRDILQEILNAIRKGDVVAAEAGLTRHIEDAQQRAQTAMRALRSEEA
jgi:DNA-binding GntR family transcriptional regulator